jgi:anti-sigma B factor antagonist
MSQPDGSQRPDLPEPFEVEVRPDHHARVFVIPRGELDMASTDKVADSIDALVGNGVAEIVLDLRELTFMDSCGVGRLVAARRRARRAGRRLVLVRGGRAIQHLLALTGMDETFEIVGDIPIALHQAAAPAPSS